MILSIAASARKALKVSLNVDNQGKFVLNPLVVLDCPIVLRLRFSTKKKEGEKE